MFENFLLKLSNHLTDWLFIQRAEQCSKLGQTGIVAQEFEIFDKEELNKFVNKMKPRLDEGDDNNKADADKGIPPAAKPDAIRTQNKQPEIEGKTEQKNKQQNGDTTHKEKVTKDQKLMKIMSLLIARDKVEDVKADQDSRLEDIKDINRLRRHNSVEMVSKNRSEHGSSSTISLSSVVLKKKV